MAAKVNMAAFGGAHTAGIFSDMTVDGPVIGTLVAIIDRARNLPNKRTMGKQDPYCAARLGKEAKKTHTDKRGGQTPKWDQELRFTVHDSPDYHRIKVSVFNDDRKTELIGDTFIALHPVITPGGGQSDGWHVLDCKGKYAGEIRIEFTYYDTRPKADKAVAEKKRETPHPDPQSPAVGGPRGARESAPIKRRPLPSDPTAAAPSPVSTPEHRGLQGVRAGPRELGSPRHRQEPSRRPVPDASPVSLVAAVPSAAPVPVPASTPTTPARHQPQDPYTPPDPRASNPALAHHGDAYDLSYAAPKPTMSHDDARAPRPHAQPLSEPLHSHSAPVLPTQHAYEPEQRFASYAQDPQEHAPPVDYRPNGYIEAASPYDDSHSPRRQSAMQPTVEDEDFDLPPPPPAHRKNAATLPHSFARHPEQSPEPSYDLQRQSYAPDYDYRQPGERRYTHPRPTVQQETSLPAALVAGLDASRRERDSYQTPPAYEMPPRPAYETLSQTPPRLRQYSEPADYRAPPQYTSPDSYYEHDPPEEPRRSPNPSPRHSPNPASERASRMAGRSMPTRKSRRLSGVPFGPDDFNVLNPSLAKPAGDEPERPGSSMEYNDKGQIVTFSGRVGTVKEKAPRIRAQLNGSRGLQEAQAREDKYRRDREERDRIRSAADPDFDTSNALSRGYGSYSSRHAGAPPIPAKIPLDRGMQNEDVALSLELQSIDIGPGSGARRPRTRGREYGAYI
ncbi:hypothetical protein ST47_g4775 [Ascochyta rabiei]|uniref:C2 domain-containing protein n=1 Tax=Didymella rabiei TaxID=5454 RepID=A0A163F1H5_DIDRA|nr:hypothetical protein ST47_g4775 [Ascochyta rabiei]